MKSVSAILLATLFLLANMQQTVYVCLYQLNKKAITEKYCVNKNVKGSCCKGKCYLEKTIAQSEKETQNPFSLLNLKLKDTELLYQPLQWLAQQASLDLILHKPDQQYMLLDGPHNSPLKPPAV